MISIVNKAKIFATAAHEAVGQVRRYTGEPFINHPARVAGMIAELRVEPEVVAAAWLHDVVEDTKVTLGVLREAFGPRVCAMVDLLTCPPRLRETRAMRKSRAMKQVRNAPTSVQSIKLADLLDNGKSLVVHDPVFARVWLGEMVLWLDVLEGGHPVLLAGAEKRLVEWTAGILRTERAPA